MDVCLLTQIGEGVISGFGRDVNENCALLGYYAGVVTFCTLDS
jgi:hypothetical protein